MNSRSFLVSMLCLTMVIVSFGLVRVEAAKPPLFTLKNIQGQNYSLKDDLCKNVILLDFWATWCKPCMRELPHVDKIYEKYKNKGLKLYTVSVDDARSKSRVKPTIRRYKFQFPLLLDPDNKVIRKFSPNGNVPYLIIIGQDGQILREFSGYNPGDEKIVEEVVIKALEKITETEHASEKPAEPAASAEK